MRYRDKSKKRLRHQARKRKPRRSRWKPGLFYERDPTPSTVLSSINLIKPAIDTRRTEGQWPWLGRTARRGCPLFQAFNQCLVDRLHRAVSPGTPAGATRWALGGLLASRVREREREKIDKTRASPPRGRAISGGEEQHPRQPASYLPPIPIRHRYNRDNLRHPVDFPTSARGIMSPRLLFLPLSLPFFFFCHVFFKQVSRDNFRRNSRMVVWEIISQTSGQRCVI